MNVRWRAPLIKVRRYMWLTELVAVLMLLLAYKFTGSETVLMYMFLSILVASVPMGVASLIIDHIEMERLGRDDDFYNAS